VTECQSHVRREYTQFSIHQKRYEIHSYQNISVRPFTWCTIGMGGNTSPAGPGPLAAASYARLSSALDRSMGKPAAGTGSIDVRARRELAGPSAMPAAIGELLYGSARIGAGLHGYRGAEHHGRHLWLQGSVPDASSRAGLVGEVPLARTRKVFD
jgi:hypothetical protein